MNNRIAIVTGASAGIGRATSLRLAKDFAGIVLVARRQEELEKTAANIKALGAEPLVLPADLRQPEAVSEIIASTKSKFGRLDAVVNIAGAVPQIHLFQMTDQQWNDGAEMKLHGARRLAIKAWPLLKESRGSVVFMSGNSAESPKPGFAAVAAINAAIVAMAKAFAEQGIIDGVQVNSILPGPVMSNRRIGFLDKWSADHQLSIDDAKEKFLQEAHIERYGKPEEVAELIAFILSPGARWLIGTAIRIDGGEIREYSFPHGMRSDHRRRRLPPQGFHPRPSRPLPPQKCPGRRPGPYILRNHLTPSLSYRSSSTTHPPPPHHSPQNPSDETGYSPSDR
ncbi:SDR family oxidoreductase [Puia sp. P3]|uniref:SDR family oxidoreductase n=1 Tax=Puia sp. P3 TaxID=3423952 RepID=UPI003D6701E5